jgi:glutamate N-acetyltransferase/amino-acid N-acetyltransferase
MAVGESSLEHHSVPGVRLASLACGIKADKTNDLVMFEFEKGSTTAGVFTKSLFAAAPVELGKKHLAKTSPEYFLINSGNANAGVGDVGLDDASACCLAVSQLAGVHPEAVIPFSTGVIGERLPVENVTNALDRLIAELSEDNWLLAAEGIMTTDTRPKITSRQISIDSKCITLTGIAKGSGMIQPNMATMLSYIATDAVIETTTLQSLLNEAVDASFNRITVDSDTSTNDSCMLTATGVSGLVIEADSSAATSFLEALTSLCKELAHGIIRDAEGATKFISVRVKGGSTRKECLEVAYSVANSPLMKTALFASDANWGRIVMAIGKADVDIDVKKLDVLLGDVRLMTQGNKDPHYSEAIGAEIFAKQEIDIVININAGDFDETVWTSDLSHEYVRINAEYRT